MGPFWSSSILVFFSFGRLQFWTSSILVIFHFGRLPFWSYSILVVFYFGRLPIWSSSILVVFYFGHLPFWLSSILVVFHFGRLPFWSSSILVVVYLSIFGIILTSTYIVTTFYTQEHRRVRIRCSNHKQSFTPVCFFLLTFPYVGTSPFFVQNFEIYCFHVSVQFV